MKGKFANFKWHTLDSELGSLSDNKEKKTITESYSKFITDVNLRYGLDLLVTIQVCLGQYMGVQCAL